MADFDFSVSSKDEQPEVDLRVDHHWGPAKIEGWQRIAGAWWATVNYVTVEGHKLRTSVPKTSSVIAMPEDYREFLRGQARY